MKSILDKDFKYTNSAQTNIRKTFQRVRRELRAEQSAKANDKDEAESLFKVRLLRAKVQ